MNDNIFITIVCALLASAGFWGFFTKVLDKRSAKSKMLLGLGHDRIMYLGMQYVKKGEITNGEYENFYKYLYKPYKDLGGNGTVDRLMREIDKLKIVSDPYSE